MEAIRDFLLVQLGEKVDKITRYAGEINLNFKCTFSNNKSYNLKLFHPTTDPQFVDFLAKVHLHCNTINYIHVAKIIPWKSKDYIHKVSYDGEMYQAILLDWIDGKLLSEIEYHPQKLLYNWGELSAKLQQSLDSFEHPYLERIFDWDCLQLELHRDKIQYLRTDQERECIHDIFHRFSQKSTELKSLPKAINHNDLHTENLLIRFDGYEPKLEGLIDFGDVLKTARICEIGIACAYAMMDKKDILSAAGNILKGYASHVKLQENEVKCIDLLIRARLAISVLTSAKKRADGVTEEYQFISEKKAWEVLKKLGSFPKNFIHYYYRASVGLSAHPNEKKFKEWCENNTSSFKEVIKLNPNSSGHIDLSVSSSVIPSTAEFENINQFNKRIQAFKEENNFVAAYGGYGEIRPFYTTDNYETENDQGYQWRTQHLGLDVWTDLTDGNGKRIEINCPYDGEIICSHNNDLTCDYGGTLIIKHNAEDFSFYTLYGHLSLDSLEMSPVGKKVKAGECVAYLGNINENGNWPAHLHFQIILDLLENTNNYPGVAYTYEWEIWKSICPNPSLLYPNTQHTNNEALNVNDLKPKRQQILGKNLSVSYRNNLVMVRGHMQYLYDISGRRYLDTVNNVAHVGHENPLVTKAAINQIPLLNTNSRYLHPEILDYAEKLLAKFPDHLTRVYFTNSGSESNELALRLASSKTHANEKLVLKMGYHGNTKGTVDLSSYKFERKGGKGIQDSISMMDYYGDENNNDKNRYLGELENLIAEKGPLTFIHESIMSCAGQVELDSEVLNEMYKRVQEKGGVCIADEVQTGFGRVGHSFWAFQLHGLQPDIVTMGKPIANGHPVGAVVCTEELAESFDNGMEYFNTYGGNPVSMKIANKVLEVVNESRLDRHAIEIERIFYECAEKLVLPADVEAKSRGKGMFLGIEFMESGKEATKFVSFVKNRMRERGFLMSSDGLHENVIKIKPPMVFSEGDMRKLFENIQRVFNEYVKLK